MNIFYMRVPCPNAVVERKLVVPLDLLYGYKF